MFLFSRPFLFGEKDGVRVVSWRVWLFLWLLPGLLALGALAMLAETGWRYAQTVPGEGEVVHVYAWEGETLFDRGRMIYAPVFLYNDGTGRAVRASTYMAAPDWNFPLGSRHAIRFDPRGQLDAMLPGASNFAVPGIIAALALLFALPALLLHVRVRRWQRGG
ncbi:hypothetical protein [Rhodalgimonas zhirmunskyi]|uniref:DUF3592 domain-containing protein n=1 Tax=Rhodalgimonas zhirmunskyi TaxID=2964767 RepID=A0AAJ1U3P2_9RHOB|nr:hypothetical protein [Rhodoalgimonas zhirmunskyi]MDQ2092645.1 hypothetical protein [Rhodoalgimonas zhirmunskyi]